MALLGSATACASADTSASPAPDQSSAYSAEFDQARANATSDFEKEVFADSNISRQEYEEAVDRFVQCLNDAGLSASAEKTDTGMYSYAIQYPAGTTEASSAETTCSKGTTFLIEGLYGSITTNPENEDFQQLVVDCLVRNDVVEQGYTKADLIQDLQANPEFHPENPAGSLCLENPKE